MECSSLTLRPEFFFIILAFLQGITQTTEQWRQLIKRMERLTKENDKLKEVMNLIERNIQRAQRERDLVESNARFLEYQKGVLSKQLASVFEQVRGESEQLSSASEQLERKFEQLKNISEQKIGMAYRRMCFVLLNSHIFCDDYCACRARCRARPAMLGRRLTPRGEGEGVRASRQTGQGAERFVPPSRSYY